MAKKKATRYTNEPVIPEGYSYQMPPSWGAIMAREKAEAKARDDGTYKEPAGLEQIQAAIAWFTEHEAEIVDMLPLVIDGSHLTKGFTREDGVFVPGWYEGFKENILGRQWPGYLVKVGEVAEGWKDSGNYGAAEVYICQPVRVLYAEHRRRQQAAKLDRQLCA